uniref:UDP-glucuronate decarboxylase N-terminal domain-containing protein n=1 Tax=Accipiter nisus TaxID=211598 RepID=A0A8B9M323_9AVES
MVSKGPLLRLLTAINRRRMKLLMGLAFVAYVASVWGNFVNMRSLQENGDQKVESKIEEVGLLTVVVCFVLRTLFHSFLIERVYLVLSRYSLFL